MQRSILVTVLVSTTLFAADAKVQFATLPAAVRAAAKTQATDAEIIGASKETEKGRTIYEVETKRDGKSRDFSFDVHGKLLELEQEIELNSIPATAKEALQKRAAGGNIQKVESVTAGKSVTYEATVITKAGKHTEIAVNADGSPHLD